MKKSDKEIFDFKALDSPKPIYLTRFTNPLPDELLSSWILRCAKSYNLKSHVFTKFIWGKTAIWNRDIDRSIKLHDLEKFAKINNTSFETAFNSTLCSYKGILFDQININGQTKYINTTGIYHRKRKYHALSYCPNCLNENNYYRKIWRVSVIIICPKCQIYLKTKCDICNSPVLPHRVYMTKEYNFNAQLTSCFNCKVSLCDTITIGANQEIKQLTNIIMKQLNGSPEDSLPYFKKLYFFIRVLSFNKTIANYLCQKKIAHIPNFSKKYFKHTFEILTLEEKKEILLGCHYLMKNWPKNFIKCIKKCKINYSHLVAEKTHKFELPDEVEKVLRKY